MVSLREHQGIEIPQLFHLCHKTIFPEIDCLVSWRPKSFLLVTLVLQSVLVISVMVRAIVSGFNKKKEERQILASLLITYPEFPPLATRKDSYVMPFLWSFSQYTAYIYVEPSYPHPPQQHLPPTKDNQFYYLTFLKHA